MHRSQLFIFFFSILFLFNLGYATQTQKTYKKIISLSPYITEIILKLESEKRLVAVTEYCNRPSQAKNKPNIGGMINPNFEEILKFSPDLIIATKEDQSKEIVHKLLDLKLNVIVLKETNNFEDIKANFLKIAEILNKTELAENQLEQILSKLQTIKNKKIKQKSVFVLLEKEPLITISQQSYINDILIFAGFKNIVNLKNPRYPTFSKEEFLLLKPDIILDISNNNQFNIDVFMRPNPYAFLEAVELLQEIKHEKI